MNVEELVVCCRDLLCEYITDTQCCCAVGCLRAVHAEPNTFISAPQMRPPKLVLGELLLKKKQNKTDSKLAWIWIVAIEFKTLAPG